MSGQALDLRRSAQIVWRHKALVGVVAALGLLAGVGYTALNPPTYLSSALVALSPSVSVASQATVVTSAPVLSLALPSVEPGTSFDTLHSRVQADRAAVGLMSVSADGSTPAQAIETANAVARSYVAYVSSANNPVGQLSAQLFQPATTATGPAPTSLPFYGAGAGVLLGALIGAITALAIGRNDRRLRERDEIANSVGVPVLASVRVRHPAKAQGWTKLLEGYEPEAADAWQLRKVLGQLGAGGGSSLAVLSLSHDRGALALGPQLAVLAASLGIPTALVVGPQPDAITAAALHAACAAGPEPRGPGNLHVTVSDHGDASQLLGGRADRRRLGRGRPGSPRRQHHAHYHDGAGRHVRYGNGAATGSRRRQRRRRRPRRRRNTRGGSESGRPDDRPPAATGTTGATQNADAHDQRSDGDHAVTDKDLAAIFSRNGNNGRPGQLEAFDDFNAVEDRPAALAPGLVSLGFIRAAIRRTALFWCALGVVGLVIGIGINKEKPAAYKASTSVLITYGPSDNPTSAVLDNQTIAESRSVAELALRKLGLQQSVASFAAATSVAVVTDRVLLITVSAPSSSAAVSRANAVAAAFLQFRASQMETSQQLLLKSLTREVSQAGQNVGSINSQISQLSAQPTSPAQQSQLKNLRTQLGQANGQLAVDEQTLEDTRTNTANLSAVTGSVVLDPAVPLAHSRLKYVLTYAVTGLLAGLALGIGIVVVRTIASDRLRRRDDVTHALGAPVKLSVGKVRLSRWRPGRRGLAAANGTNVRRIVAYLRGAVPASRGRTALALVPVDDPAVAALSLVSMAVTRAQEGHQVVVADLASGTPAARLLDSKAPGVRSVSVRDAHLILAVPDRDDIAPAGPLGSGPAEGQRSAFTEAVGNACASADLLLTLVTVDPSLGTENLATWAASAVVVVTAGRSSWARINAVGEMIRLAGTSLTSAVLVGADKTDESLGVTEVPGALTDISDLA